MYIFQGGLGRSGRAAHRLRGHALLPRVRFHPVRRPAAALRRHRPPRLRPGEVLPGRREALPPRHRAAGGGPGMEFLNGFFSRGCSDSSFRLVFYPQFSVLQNAFREKTQVFLFWGFFVRIIKSREEYSFL
jgi:hypothetical protein